MFDNVQTGRYQRLENPIMDSTLLAPLRSSYPVTPRERVGWHLGKYKDRRITVATYRCDDGKYCIEGVKVDVRKGEQVVTVDMRYMGIVDADEQKVVQRAIADAQVYVQSRY